MLGFETVLHPRPSASSFWTRSDSNLTEKSLCKRRKHSTHDFRCFEGDLETESGFNRFLKRRLSDKKIAHPKNLMFPRSLRDKYVYFSIPIFHTPKGRFLSNDAQALTKSNHSKINKFS